MPLPLRLFLSVLAGVAAAVSFEPYGLVLLLPIAVAALSLLLRGLTPRRGFLVGAVFGTVFMLVLLPWLQVIGVDAWVALSLLEGLFYGILGLGAVVVGRLPWWPVWTATVWVAVEAFRGTFPFGGFPWGRLAFATAGTPVADLFAYVGAAGVTFAVALLGTSLAWAVTAIRRAPLRAAAAVLVGAVIAVSSSAFGPGTPSPQAEPGRVVTVAAVQGNVPGEGMDAFSERRAVLDNHVAATHQLAADVASGAAPAPDFVVWPENSTDIDPFEDPTVHADIQGAVDAVGVPVLVGAMVSGAEPGDVYNQGIVWQPDTGPAETYAKRHPVPFGEYIPFRDVLSGFISRLEQIPRDMVPGAEPGVLELGGTTVGDVICFEVAYDELLRDVVDGGADMVVVQTNNATYMGTGQVEQQFAISRLRAIETGRYVVVAATNGVTGVIAPTGEVVERAPVRTRAVLSHALPIYGGTTPAVRWGQGLELLLVLVSAVSVSVGVGLHYRRRRVGGSDRRELATTRTGA
jgi:apolipoprotein N-acyltransferase